VDRDRGVALVVGCGVAVGAVDVVTPAFSLASIVEV
jgi:hypothetical protein